MGVGVAGLQAIATARRLGAVVRAYDVRAAAKEEAESLGATFVDLGISAEGAGGYARELAPEELDRQQAGARRGGRRVATCVITTAAVPGRHAPVLVTRRPWSGDGAGRRRDRHGGRFGRQLRGHPAGRGGRCSRGRRSSAWPTRRRRCRRTPASSTPATSPTCSRSSAGTARSPRTGTTRSSPAAASSGPARRPRPARRGRSASRTAPVGGTETDDAEVVVTNGLLELFTIFVLSAFVGFEVDLQGPEHPAHPAHVGLQRDPRRDPRRGR